MARYELVPTSKLLFVCNILLSSYIANETIKAFLWLFWNFLVTYALSKFFYELQNFPKLLYDYETLKSFIVAQNT